MNDNMDFKTLWDGQKTTPPDIGELFREADRFKGKRLSTLVKMNLCLLLTAAFIGFVWFWYQPEWLTTKIGICVVFLAIFVFLASYAKLLPLFVKPGFELNSKQYLQQLSRIKNRERFLQKTMMKLYFLLLTLGICLYMLEYTSRMKPVWAVVTYAVVLLWIGFNWFYLGPKIRRKQNQGLHQLIEKFDNIAAQFDKNEKV